MMEAVRTSEVFFHSGFLTNTFKYYLPLCDTFRGHLILLDLTARNTFGEDYEALHYVIVSILLLLPVSYFQVPSSPSSSLRLSVNGLFFV
jgi:hypothetical protein